MSFEEKVLRDMYATLAELQSGTTKDNKILHTYLVHKLDVLYNLIDNYCSDSLDEKFIEQIEEWI